MATRKVDLCIVGGSAAGMSAALVAKRKGVKDVLILEKMASTGGTARMTDGIMAIGTQTQRDLGLYYDIDQFYKDVMTVQDWHCDAKLVRKWLSGTAASMELLESIGMHYGLAVTETADINRFRRTRFPHRGGHALEHRRRLLHGPGGRRRPGPRGGLLYGAAQPL